MKQLYSVLFLFTLFSLLFSPSAVSQKRIDQETQIESLLQSRNFIFKAQSANPMRGSIVQLTSPYDMVVSGDTLRTYLPYFGRAYSAPVNTGEGGIKIRSTDFDYVVSNKRKKRWNITIKPMDDPQVQQMILSVSTGGYATLRINSTNRDPITFNGYITAKE